MSVTRRPAVLAVGAAILIALVVWFAFLRDDRPSFAVDDDTFSSSDGEGLMGGRARARATVGAPGTRDPLVIRLSAPGSRVVGFAVVRLDRDAPAMRIRQVSVDETPAEDSPARVGWRGFVATQREGDASDLRELLGPWRATPSAGILVRPGQIVRLRTRYDLRRPVRRGACWEVDLEDAPPWLVREDGDDGDWEPLRARDDDGDDHRDVVVSTGQAGPLQLASGRGTCRSTNGLGFGFEDDD